MEFNFSLTEQESQIMLDALAKEPYSLVVGLINKIQGQAFEQRREVEDNNKTFGVDVSDSDKAI